MNWWQAVLATMACIAVIAFNAGMDSELDRQSALRNNIVTMNYERTMTHATISK